MDGLSQSWIELDRAAIAHNVGEFRSLVGAERRLMVVVKANAYGHGMVPVAQVALEAGADWLAVFAVEEAFGLRDAGITAPVLVLGPTPPAALPRVSRDQIAITVANPDAAADVVAAEVPLSIHLKLETGTHRQGFSPSDLEAISRLDATGNVEIAGAYTHYANIEDTTDHTFARIQLVAFRDFVSRLAARGIEPPLLHTACTAATLLFESTYYAMARVGIGLYGLWPSKETLVSARSDGRPPVALRPVMTWKTRITQVTDAPPGVTVGYGRTLKTTRRSRLAVLPVGYANGYGRGLSNTGHVLVRGQRAKVCGRVMMNMIVVDVTDIDGAAVGDEVVLLGRQGDETITAELLAAGLDTINYEVVTRADPFAPRLVV